MRYSLRYERTTLRCSLDRAAARGVPMTSSPTCQNLVMRERDGVDCIEPCWRGAMTVFDDVSYCKGCVQVEIDQHMREHRARCEDGAERIGKA